MHTLELVCLFGLFFSVSCDITSFTDVTTNRCYANYDITLSCVSDGRADIFTHSSQITRGCSAITGIDRYETDSGCDNPGNVVLTVKDPDPTRDFGEWKCHENGGVTRKSLQVNAGIS